MPTALPSLPTDAEQLHDLILDLQAQLAAKDNQIEHLQQQYQHMLEQFRLAQQRQFGRSGEASADQLGLFNESEQLTEDITDEAVPERETLTYTRNKPKLELFTAILTDLVEVTAAAVTHFIGFGDIVHHGFPW